MQRRLKVFIIDDSDTAKGLQSYLTPFELFDVSIYNSLHILLKLTEKSSLISKEDLYVIVLDMMFNNEKYAGIEKYAEIKDSLRLLNNVSVLILSSYKDYDLISKSKSFGALGYIYKNEYNAYEMVKKNLEWVLNNQIKSFENCSSDTIRDILTQNINADISILQLEILNLLSKGMTVQEIATSLNREAYNINYEIKNIAKRWNMVNKIPSLLVRAYKKGIIDVNE